MYQREAPHRLRVAVVGAGSHSYRNVLPTLTYLPVELVAVVDPSDAVRDSTARQYAATGYASTAHMYENEDVDAVLLCVGPALHPVLAREGFAQGVHVWMEKPVGVVAEDAASLISARGDLVCVVGYKKAFMPATRKAKELLALPEFGALQTASGFYWIDVPRDGDGIVARREQPNWLINGCHPLSVLLELAGPVASASTFRASSGGGSLVLEHQGGGVSTLALTPGAPWAQPLGPYTFVGDGRSVSIENTRRVVFQRGIPLDYATGTTFAPEGLGHGAIVWEAQDTLNTLENKAVITQGLHGSLAHFCAAVLDGTPATIGTLEFAHHLMKVYEAAMRSDGERVRIGDS